MSSREYMRAYMRRTKAQRLAAQEAHIPEPHLVSLRAVDRCRAAYLPEVEPHLQDWMAQLGYRERVVLTFRFGLDGEPIMTLGELAARFNVTGEWIRIIEQTAIQKLRKLSGVRAPEPEDNPPPIAQIHPSVGRRICYQLRSPDFGPRFEYALFGWRGRDADHDACLRILQRKAFTPLRAVWGSQSVKLHCSSYAFVRLTHRWSIAFWVVFDATGEFVVMGRHQAHLERILTQLHWSQKERQG